MMNAPFPTGPVHGVLTVPGDRAITMRALAVAAIANGFTIVSRGSRAREVLALRDALVALGARMHSFGEGEVPLMITGAPLHDAEQGLDLDAYPAAAALAGAVCAGRGLRARVTASPIDASAADAKTATLMEAAAAGRAAHFDGDPDLPDHTERMLDRFGAEIRYDGLHVDLQASFLVGTEVEVPGDFSAAAAPLVAACSVPGSELVVENVNINRTRTALLDVLTTMGAQIAYERLIEVGNEPIADIRVFGRALHGMAVDAPTTARLGTELPLAAAVAATAAGKTTFAGVAPSRFAPIAAMLRLFGVAVEVVPEGFAVVGMPGGLRTPERAVATFGDPHIGLAGAALAAAGGSVVLDERKTIDDHFPDLLDRWISLPPSP
jgi:3-phosphoshikimate 1-carboxyvinyltransferase